MKDLTALFRPKSVAVVGVSEDPTKLSSVVFNNMIDAGYELPLYPVNPKYAGGELYLHKVYASVKDIEGDLDLAVILVPNEIVPSVMQDCAEKKVKAVVIISAGFREIGEEGRILEDKVLEIASSADITVLGPNCLGFITPSEFVNASFAALTPIDGNIGFMSQSGAFCTALLDMAVPANLGFEYFVSLGNKSDIDEVDLLKNWMHDDKVNVIGAYIEHISHGLEFIKVSAYQEKLKPIILFKPGQSEEAKIAISSHTGAVTGPIEVFKTAVKQNGLIEAPSIRSFFNFMLGFSRLPMPEGDRVAIVTNAGGPGVIATDLVVQSGLKIAKFSSDLEETLRGFLPFTANVHNPVDVIGDALADRYQNSIKHLAESDDVDAILVILTPQLVTQIEETAKSVINSMSKYKKPIIPILLGERYTMPAISRIFDRKFAAYKEINDAVEVLKIMYDFNKFAKARSIQVLDQKQFVLGSNNMGRHVDEMKKHIGDGSNALPDELVDKLMQEIEFPVPPQQVTENIDQAIGFANENYPIVIKATNTAIVHKTDFKAVYMDLKNDDELRNAYAELQQTIKEKTGNENVMILVQKQIVFEEQFFIGANRDGGDDVYNADSKGGFGHLLVFGQGGIYTEIYKDLAYAVVPAGKDDIEASLALTKISKILSGARGKDPLPKEKIIDAILKIQKLVVLYPMIRSVDINPLLVSKDEVYAVDIKIFL